MHAYTYTRRNRDGMITLCSATILQLKSLIFFKQKISPRKDIQDRIRNVLYLEITI